MQYWAEFPVLCGRPLLVIYFIYGSMYMSIPIFQFISHNPLPPVPTKIKMLIFYTCDSISFFVDEFICIFFFFFFFKILHIRYLSFSVWLHSVWQSLGPFMLLQMALFCSFLWLIFLVYVYHIFLHSSVDGHLGHFYVLAILNSVAMDIEVYVSFWSMSFLWIYAHKWDCWIIW